MTTRTQVLLVVGPDDDARDAVEFILENFKGSHGDRSRHVKIDGGVVVVKRLDQNMRGLHSWHTVYDTAALDIMRGTANNRVATAKQGLALAKKELRAARQHLKDVLEISRA